MAAPTSTNEVTARKLSSSISALWTKIKSTFQPVADRVTSWSSTPSDTKYPSEKLVKDCLDGKLPKTTNASEIISSAYPQCFYSTSYYYSGYVLFYDVTSAFDGTFTNLSGDGDHVAFSGFVQSAKYNGYGEPQFYKVEGKVNGKYPTNYNASTSKTYGPVVLKRTYEEYGVTKERYYFAIKVPANYSYGMMFFGVFHTRGRSGTALSWDSGFLGTLVQSSDTEYAVHWSWTAGYNVAASLFTSRKLAVSLSNTSTDTSFDGSANVTNIKTTGTLGVGNGGTGRTSVTSGNYVVGAGTSAMVEKTPKEVGSNVLSSLDDKSSASSYADFVDDDFLIGSDHVDASTISSSTFVRRTAVKLWNYINGKISSVLGLTASSYGGNAATATKATQDGSGNTIDGTYKKHSTEDKFTVPQVIDDDSRTTYQSIRIGNKFKRISVGITGAGNVNISEMTGRDNSPDSEKSIIYTTNGGINYYFNGVASTASALADDSGYLHIAGSETVTGDKTFSARWVMSKSMSGSSSGFFTERVATQDSNKKYGVSLEIVDSGNRGLYDFGTSGNYAYAGQHNWILKKDSSNNIHVGDSSNKVYVSGKCLDYSGTIGNDPDTFYVG